MDKIQTLILALEALQQTMASALDSAKDLQTQAEALKADMEGATPVTPVGPAVPMTDDEKDAKIVELQVQVQQLQNDLNDMKLSIDQAVATACQQAIADFKAQLKAKYDEQQVAETAAETGFAELLK